MAASAGCCDSLYLGQGKLTSLLPPEGYQGSWIYGAGHALNASGQAAGTAAKVDSSLPSPPGWNGHPVLVEKVPVVWDRKGKSQILALPEGYSEGSSWAINNRGQAVGWAGNNLGVDDAGPWGEYWMLWEWQVAVLWDKNGRPTVLPLLPEFQGGRSIASSINDTGLIIGSMSTWDLSKTHAVMWKKRQVIDLTPLDEGYSEAGGNNHQGAGSCEFREPGALHLGKRNTARGKIKRCVN